MSCSRSRRSTTPGMLAELIRALRVMSGADESAEAAAQRRYASRHLTLHRTIDGMLSISGMVDPMSAAIIEAALAPLIAKKNNAGRPVQLGRDGRVP